jgi:8-oxo-dGTP diphosphatase
MRYYIETDGRIFLILNNGEWDLPRPDQVPFTVEKIARLPAEEETWFCSPDLPSHPRDWPSKDEVQQRADIASRVLVAVHATMPRVVVEAICIDGGKVLLVKGSRGLTTGRWSLPGGFLRFGESPEEGVVREVHEEVGANAVIVAPAGTHSKLGSFSKLHWIMFFYRVAVRGEPRPNPDEIAEVRFVPVDDAEAFLEDPVMAAAIRRAAQETP